MLRYWISLTNSKKRFCVDACDYDRVRVHNWYLDTNGGSIRGCVYGKNVYLTRFLLGVKDSKVDIDHINHNIFDNRRCNLREGTHQQNLFNQKTGVHSSKFKGVYWRKDRCRWIAKIMRSGVSTYLGYFDSEIEAALAYDKAAKRLFGEFACLNFPEE